MRFIEILLESFSLARREFIQHANDQQLVDKTIEEYRKVAKRSDVTQQQKDINYWRKRGWDQFHQFVTGMAKLDTKSKIKRNQDIGRSIPVFENDEWLIIIPLDRAASCYHGRNTDWCTTKPVNNYFTDYFHLGKSTIVYCLNKQNQKKWAINFDDDDIIELFDENDDILSFDLFKTQTKLDPVKIINQITGKDLTDQIYNIGDENRKRISQTRTEYEEIYNLASKQLRTNVIDKRDLTLEKYLVYLKVPDLSVKYIKNLIYNNQSVSNVPSSIKIESASKLRDNDVQQLELTTKEKKTVLRDNPSMLQYMGYDDPELVKTVVKKYPRYLKLAQIPITIDFLKDIPEAAAYYATTIKQERIEDLEPYIAKDANAAISYAEHFYRNGWPEAESTIMKHPYAASSYAINILNKKWPEAEPTIKSSEFAWDDYKKHFNI